MAAHYAMTIMYSQLRNTTLVAVARVRIGEQAPAVRSIPWTCVFRSSRKCAGIENLMNHRETVLQEDIFDLQPAV